MPHQCTNCGRTFPDGSKEMLSGCPDCGGNKFQFEPSGSTSTGGGGAAEQSAATAPPESADRPESRDSGSDSGVGDTVSQAKKTVRDWVGRDGLSGSDDDASASEADRSTADAASTGDWPDVGSRPDASSRSTADVAEQRERRSGSADSTSAGAESRSPDETAAPAGEDSAQAQARSDVVDPNDLPDGAASGGSEPADHPLDASESGAPPDDVDGEVVGTPDDDQPDLEALRKELNEQFESIKIVRPGEYELNLMELYDRDEYIISLMEDGRYAIEVPDAWRGGE